MEATLQHLFKKNNLQEIPIETLQQVTREFPYFALGQFLETSRLKQLKAAAFDDQFQKTLLYFHNPLWLQHQLSEVPALVDNAPTNSDSEGFPGNAVSETGADPDQLSHDLVEEVVLHPENDLANSLTTDILPEVHVVETIKEEPEPEKQTIQREEPFTFQAYYTVDYFASQGIKVNIDGQQQDKLGKQLKSFTEWLKTMRRLPETSVVEILDKIKEGEIAKIAAHSLEEKEVVTEAMAEVLVNQGQLNKARDLYNKLSLQNPHKSTYFAARIEDLKQH